MVAGYALAGPVYIRVCVRVRLGNNGPRPCAPLLIRLGRLITNISLATDTDHRALPANQVNKNTNNNSVTNWVNDRWTPVNLLTGQQLTVDWSNKAGGA